MTEVPIIRTEDTEQAEIRQSLVAFIKKAARGRVTLEKAIVLLLTIREYKLLDSREYLVSSELGDKQEKPPEHGEDV